MVEHMSTIAGLLRDSLKAVEEAEIPEDLRQVAFARAFDTIAGQGARVPGVAPRTGGGGGGPSGGSGSGDVGDPLARIAAKLEIDDETVDAAFHLDDEGQVQLGVPARKLDARKTKATQQIALLLASARQAAGAEERTPVGVIRDAVTAYGKRDEANFASTIGEMDEVFNITGSGHQRRVKVNRKGFEDAGELAKALTGA